MPEPFTLALVQPSQPCKVEAFYESGYEGKTKFRKRLQLDYRGIRHEFDITDTAFLRRHQLASKAQSGGFEMTLENPEKVFLCLSLTPAFYGHHYKIAAAIIELP